MHMEENNLSTIIVKEQFRYTQDELAELFQSSKGKTVLLIRKLKEYGILKAVSSKSKKDLSDLVDIDIEICEVLSGDDSYYYVFTFVGVVVVNGYVIWSIPKYFKSKECSTDEFKQIVKVLDKYNKTKEQIVHFYCDKQEGTEYNALAIILYLLNDYFEYGLYTQQETIVESNGTGEILWDRTINETFTLISNNRPYYIDLKTRKKINDEENFIRLVHKNVLNRCSKDLLHCGLLEVFDLEEVCLPCEDVFDDADLEYVLYRLSQEINVQFNTRKTLLLKTMFAYLAKTSTIRDDDSFSIFGSNAFHTVWEAVCKDIFGDILNNYVEGHQIPETFVSSGSSLRYIDLIKKPEWKCWQWEKSVKGKDTLIPDIVCLSKNNLVIFDAKYYNLVLDENRDPIGAPGIESIAKQHLYHLAYREFAELNGLTITNAFVFPSEEMDVANIGVVSLPILSTLGLADIQVVFLPCQKAFHAYLNSNRISIDFLK